ASDRRLRSGSRSARSGVRRRADPPRARRRAVAGRRRSRVTTDGGETHPTRSPRRPIGELVVSTGADAGLRVAVADDTVLGRDDEADVVLQDPSGKLSRRHARIRLSDGMPMIEDLESTNGTYLNGKRIDAPQPLKEGDRIAIGESTLEFV